MYLRDSCSLDALLSLAQDHSHLWDIEVEFLQILGLLDELKDLGVKVHKELVGELGMAHHERCIEAGASSLDRAVPASVIQHLKLHQHGGHLVEVAHHLLALVTLKMRQIFQYRVFLLCQWLFSICSSCTELLIIYNCYMWCYITISCIPVVKGGVTLSHSILTLSLSPL